jgi:hypothetical protein
VSQLTSKHSLSQLGYFITLAPMNLWLLNYGIIMALTLEYNGQENQFLICVCFLKNLAVGTRAGGCHNQSVIVNPINKQPIRLDVAVTVSRPIAGQRMVVILFGEWLSFPKQYDDFIQEIHICAALRHTP